MELNLQPRASSCFVSGQPFREGDRVASLLVRSDSGEVVRYDALESHTASLTPAGFVACRWVQVFRPQPPEENRDRTLKLTAETLFLTLADPSTEATADSDRLVRFLALLLERKRLLRPRGKTSDGARERFEHVRSKQIYEVPSIDLGPEFFSAVREQLSVLVGESKPPEPAPAGAETAAPS
jgi:hypothetical protein